MSTLAGVIQRGLRSAQPAATAVPAGTLYFVTDEDVTERSSGSAWQSYSGAGGGGGGGTIVQIVTTQSGAQAASSTTIPFDDTIPQNTEGQEILTRAITPDDAANMLQIDVTIFATSTATPWIIVALFQDSTANALAVAAAFVNLSTSGTTITFRHTMTAGTTSATTFKVRVGPSSAATVTINGQSGGRIFGGVAASSLTVTEYVP